MKRVKYWCDRMTGTNPTPKPTSAPATLNIDALADAVIRGEYGNREERRRLGNPYD